MVERHEANQKTTCAKISASLHSNYIEKISLQLVSLMERAPFLKEWGFVNKIVI